MNALTITAGSLRPFLLDACGYKEDLLQVDYEFARGQSVGLAAFAHRPFDARSACIAAIDCRSDDPKSEVMQRRELGAPLVFACFRDRLQLWKPGPDDARCVEQGLTSGQLRGFFDAYKSDFLPGRIYDAKTLGRIPGSGRQLDLFVDVRLLPFAEREIGTRLTQAVVEAVGILEQGFVSREMTESRSRRNWIFKTTFRLLAAKILQDKEVPGFRSLRLTNLEDVFRRIQNHYGSKEAVSLGGARRRGAVRTVARYFRDFGSLRNLTTEALADVYERALITGPTRRLQGTHGTPSYLADYIIWQLAPWIATINPSDLFVFEPACGHAPFLVGMVRLLRNLGLGMSLDELSTFLRQHLGGIEQDRFALEIARLSLTVADIPNPNGWDELRPGNMFRGSRLEDRASNCRVLLSNPPFGGTKPQQMLQRTLPHLPPGAVFGFIVPAGLLSSPKKRSTFLREWLTQNCRLSEICLFSDKIFRFADQECAVLIGRRARGSTIQSSAIRLRRVREEQTEDFQEQYAVTTDRLVPQAHLTAQARASLWVPEFQDEIWSWLFGLPRLDSIAQLGQGLVHKSRANLPPGAITVRDEEFPGSVLGFTGCRGNPQIHQLPNKRKYLNLDPVTIRRRVSGADVGRRQVLLNYAPARRSIWRLRPFIDEHGHPVSSRFILVRPIAEDCPLEYLWALCNSPLANAYAYTHTLKRDILVGVMRAMRVPRTSRLGVQRVADAARNYLDAASRFDASFSADKGEFRPLFDPPPPESVGIPTLHRLLKVMDAEVLRLYDLPARSEKMLLDLFADKERPGVPGRFVGYYPRDFKESVPLYAYLSESFQRSRSSGSPELPQDQQAQYDELVDKQLAGDLTPEVENALYRLQAEVDGRDYAVQVTDNSWAESIELEQQETQRTLSRVADDFADVIPDGTPPDEDSSPR